MIVWKEWRVERICTQYDALMIVELLLMLSNVHLRKRPTTQHEWLRGIHWWLLRRYSVCRGRIAAIVTIPMGDAQIVQWLRIQHCAV